MPPEAQFVQAECRTRAEVLTPGAGFDAVLHFAGLIAAGESMARPELHWDANTRAGLDLLDAMRAVGVRRLIYSSTAACYGEPSELPLTERAITMPINTYGASKLAVDHMISAEARAYEFGAVSLRYFNVAGALVRRTAHDRRAPRPGDAPDPDRPRSRGRAAGEDADVRRRLPDAGRHVHPRLHPRRRPGSGAPAGAGGGGAGEHRIYNLGTGTGFSNKQVVEAVRQVTGHPIPIEWSPRRPGDPAALYASSERIRTELGWAPEHAELTDIVADAWAFFQRYHA